MLRHLLLFVGLLGLSARAEDKIPSLPTDDPQAVALYRASYDGDVDTARELILSGAPVDGHIGKLHFTPLVAAAYKAHVDVLKMLLDYHASINLVDNEGSTPLLHACWENHTDCALALIDAGADVNLASHFGRTPLMYAAKNGDDRTVQALIAHKVNLDAMCSDGPAISWAVGSGHLSTVKLLGDAGANPNLEPEVVTTLTALGAAVAMNNVEIMDYLIGIKADINALDKAFQTPLQVAIWFNAKDAAVDLLAHGANPDICDKYGETALMRAAEWDRIDLVRVLVNGKANVNLANPQEETALTLAGGRGELDIVNLLKDAGAQRTDLHVVIRPTTKPTPSPAQQWSLAVAALYSLRDGNNPRVLGGDIEPPSTSKDMLKEGWNITNKAGLFKELDDLRDRGHHSVYRRIGAALAQLTDDQFKQLIEKHLDKAEMITAQRDSYREWKDRTGLAWDLCRAANLVNHAYSAGYITEDEAWARLAEIARITQGSFKSWQEMSENFLDGREIWANDRDTRFQGCANLLLNAQDPNSPWAQLPWATNLAGISTDSPAPLSPH